MARYPLHATAIPADNLHQGLLQLLESCQLDIIHDTGDYVMAREAPNGKPFAKLVTVEGLIDKTGATKDSISIEVVVKNEELPIHNDNHCSRMRDTVRGAMENSGIWTIVAALDS